MNDATQVRVRALLIRAWHDHMAACAYRRCHPGPLSDLAVALTRAVVELLRVEAR